MVKIKGTNKHITREGVVKKNPASQGMNDVIKTIAEQVGWRELRMAKFKFGYDNSKNELTVMRARKYVKITYNTGSDLYDVEIGNVKKDWSLESRKQEGMGAEDLRGIIMEHFRGFEYVMDNLRIVGINA